MKIHYMEGLAPCKDTWYVANRLDLCRPRMWPGFTEIEPPKDLSTMARKLFSLENKSAELVQPLETVDFCAQLAEVVSKVEYNSARLSGGQKGDCHAESLKLYDPARHDLYTGFSLHWSIDRAVWDPHTFLMEGDTLIETTHIVRDSYYGLKLNSGKIN